MSLGVGALNPNIRLRKIESLFSLEIYCKSHHTIVNTYRYVIKTAVANCSLSDSIIS